MKILLAPDSFKGALSAADAAAAMAHGVHRVWPEAECVSLPLADGGEGTLDTLLDASPGSRRLVETVSGPMGSPVEAAWGILADGETAVIELAQAAGLTLVPPEQRDPKRTTTRGVGELIADAAARPEIRRLLLTLGGSATNDGGAGILQALGVGLCDAEGRELAAGGAALGTLGSLSPPPASRYPPSLPAVLPSREGGKTRFTTVQIACDVDNPLTGPRGASAVFGPQKGASPEDVVLLDDALAHYARVLGISPDVPGLGAAGGTPAALLYLFPHARLRPGIELVLDALRFDEHLADADLVLTGEGRLDAQTLGGKAIAGVARRARAAGVPVGAIVGGLDAALDSGRLAQELGVAAVMALAPGPCTQEESVANAVDWLAAATERAVRWMAMGRRAGATKPEPSA